MCGIVGKLSPATPEEMMEILKKGFEALEHRGDDSYGVVAVTDKGLFVAKAMYVEELFEELRKDLMEFGIDNIRWFVGHNRKRSTGSIDIETAHPVWDKERKLAVVQNGTKKAVYELLTSARSDTHGILLLYDRVEKGLMKEILSGAGVVFIFDRQNDKVIFHKDSSRTLFINTEKVIASEPIEAGEWALIKGQYVEANLQHGLTLEVEEPKKIEVSRVEYRSYCPACRESKKIETQGDRRCPTCFYLGKEAERSYVSTHGSLYGGWQ